ncbi:MAG: large-conductance mechanosensitive channel protein MscL [bacterium]
MSILKEFKAFAMRGNVIDLAVGVIIGGAFGKIVTSLVADIIMPLVGLLIGGFNVSTLKVTLKSPVTDAAGKVIKDAVTLNYGSFVQFTVDFVIIAFAIFMFIKLINSMKRQETALPEAPPEPTKEEILLTEIRDLLKNK